MKTALLICLLALAGLAAGCRSDNPNDLKFPPVQYEKK